MTKLAVTSPVKIHKRRPMWISRKKRIHEARKGLCAWCGKPVELKGPNVVYDHFIPLALGGSDLDDNIRPLHASPCDKIKTAFDKKRIAKAERIERRLNGTRRKRAKINGPPKGSLSHPTLKRTLSGQVVPR